jgi:hypothetical protein
MGLGSQYTLHTRIVASIAVKDLVLRPQDVFQTVPASPPLSSHTLLGLGYICHHGGRHGHPELITSGAITLLVEQDSCLLQVFLGSKTGKLLSIACRKPLLQTKVAQTASREDVENPRPKFSAHARLKIPFSSCRMLR